MDLLRAAVAGAAGTPYHDQLFFFDIQLPPDYPGAPPLVQYHSWGMRANPNLVRPAAGWSGPPPLLWPLMQRPRLVP